MGIDTFRALAVKELIINESISSANNTNLVLLGNGTGYVAVGTGTSSRGLNTANDLFVTGQLEIDGAATFDSTVAVYGAETHYSNLRISAGLDILLGTGATTCNLSFVTTHTTDCAVCGLDDTSLNWIFTKSANIDKDHDRAASSTPTVFFFSNTDPDSANDEWLSITHDVTDGVITTGSGDLKLAPATDVVSFGTYAAISGETLQGYITIKDSSGNSRKVGVVA